MLGLAGLECQMEFNMLKGSVLLMSVVFAGGALAGAGSVLGQPAPAPSPVPAQEPGVASDPFGAVAPSRAAAAASRERAENARELLAEHVRNQRLLFENSPEYRTALADHRLAYAEWVSARDAVIAGLADDVELAEARKIHTDLGRQIRAEHASPRPDPVKIGALTEYRLNVGRQITTREAQALAADAGVAEARRRLADAGARLDIARRDQAVRMQTAPEIAAARAGVRQADEARAYTSRLATETARTADVLLRYAYYVQNLANNRPYVVYSPYVPYYPTGVAAFPGAGPVDGAGASGIGYGLMPGR